MPITLKLNLSKIPEGRIFKGKKGDYIDLVLFEKPNDFGDDGFISISVSKEDREAGNRGEIVGNWKHTGGKPSERPPARRPAPPPQRPPARRPADPDLDAPEEPLPF